MTQETPSSDVTNRANLGAILARKERVIELLRDQIGHVVLSNSEQAAQIEEMGAEIQALRHAISAKVDEPEA